MMNGAAETGKRDFNMDNSENAVLDLHSCLNCSRTFRIEQCYRCVACDQFQTDKKTSVDYFCETCITSLHIVQNHDVIDHKGYEPELCAKHSSICVLFCETCQIVFCRFCTELHTDHSFHSTETKASTVRKEIFEFLTENEKLQKPMLQRESILKEYRKQRDFILSSLKLENFSKLFETFIRDNCEEIVQDLNKMIETLVKDGEPSENAQKTFLATLASNNEKTEKVRTMLSLSDGKCVSQYAKFGSELASVVTGQNEKINKHYSLKMSSNLDNIFGESVKKAIEQFQLPQLLIRSLTPIELIRNDVSEIKRNVSLAEKNKCSEEVGSSDAGSLDSSLFWLSTIKLPPSKSFSGLSDFRSSDLFNVDREENSVNFWLLKQECHKWSKIEFTFNESDDVSSIQRDREYFAFAYSDGSFKIAKMLSGIILETRKLEGELLDFTISDTSNYQILVWNTSESKLLFSVYRLSSENYSSFQITEVCERPKLAACSGDFIAIVSSDNSLLLSATNSKDELRKYLRIQSPEHGLSKIDKLQFTKNDRVSFFDYRLREFVTVQLSKISGSGEIQWSINETAKITLPSLEKITECGFLERGTLFAVVADQLFLNSCEKNAIGSKFLKEANGAANSESESDRRRGDLLVPDQKDKRPKRLRESLHTGRFKGIQGHGGSSLIDCLIYSLFLFNDSLDYVFEPNDDDAPFYLDLKTQFRRLIVNPLRSDECFVSADHMRHFMEQLKPFLLIGEQENEETAENFLSVLLSCNFSGGHGHSPLIHFKNLLLNKDEFCSVYQIDILPENSGKFSGQQNSIPHLIDILAHSMVLQGQFLNENPQLLMVQLPKVGEKGIFSGVYFPEKLDISEISAFGKPICCVCGEAAVLRCCTCTLDTPSQEITKKHFSVKAFCKDCFDLVHRRITTHCAEHFQISEPSLNSKVSNNYSLEAVICHGMDNYVSLVRAESQGCKNNFNWLFFDSMVESGCSGGYVSDVKEAPYISRNLGILSFETPTKRHIYVKSGTSFHYNPKDFKFLMNHANICVYKQN